MIRESQEHYTLKTCFLFAQRCYEEEPHFQDLGFWHGEFLGLILPVTSDRRCWNQMNLKVQSRVFRFVELDFLFSPGSAHWADYWASHRAICNVISLFHGTKSIRGSNMNCEQSKHQVIWVKTGSKKRLAFSFLSNYQSWQLLLFIPPKIIFWVVF